MFTGLQRRVVRLLSRFGEALARASLRRRRHFVVVERFPPVPAIPEALRPFAAELEAMRTAKQCLAGARLAGVERRIEKSAGGRLSARLEGDRAAVLEPVIRATLKSAVPHEPERSPSETLLWRR